MNGMFKHIEDFVDDYRIPFFMHISGFKYYEIAEKMGLPIGTVKSRIFFVRKKIQGTLIDLHQNEPKKIKHLLTDCT